MDPDSDPVCLERLDLDSANFRPEAKTLGKWYLYLFPFILAEKDHVTPFTLIACPYSKAVKATGKSRFLLYIQTVFI